MVFLVMTHQDRIIQEHGIFSEAVKAREFVDRNPWDFDGKTTHVDAYVVDGVEGGLLGNVLERSCDGVWTGPFKDGTTSQTGEKR